MKYRVIHCGTGNIGQHALRAILRNPELELVGHYVSSPEKADQDSGELVGAPTAGIKATNNWSDLYELKADCLTYFGNSMGREEAAIDDLVPFLERGTNVITFSGFSLAHPPTTPTAQREMIEAACREGNSTCFFTGLDPGWATTDLAIAALAAADEISCVRMTELGYFGGYSAELAMRHYFGFGQDENFVPLFVSRGFAEKTWKPTLHHLADVLETEIEEFKLIWERASLDYDIETGFGPVRAGTTAIIHFEYQALKNGKPFIVLEHVDSVTRDFANVRWKRPNAPVDLAYRIEIEGTPSFNLELSWEKDGGLLCAMPAVNAVPVVCEAQPGLLGPLDIPRYWSRRRVVSAGK